MTPFITKESRLRLRILGWYQIIGGIAGVLLTGWLVTRTESAAALLLFIILGAFLLYAFSIYCGKLLLGHQPLNGLKLSIINQGLQVLTFKVAGFGFQYISGLMFLIGVKKESGLSLSLDLNFSLTSTWFVDFKSDEGSVIFAINLVAIYFIFFAERLGQRLKREKRTQLATVEDPNLDAPEN